MAEPSLDEWWGHFCARRARAKEALNGEYDEYTERYERVIDDADRALRSFCNRFHKIDYDKRNRCLREISKGGE